MASKTSDNDTKLAWYRVPIVWLGIALTIFIAFVCASFVYIAHTYAPLDKNHQPKGQEKQLNSILGMPLKAPEPIKETSKTHE